jgi:hypothetical protein
VIKTAIENVIRPILKTVHQPRNSAASWLVSNIGIVIDLLEKIELAGPFDLKEFSACVTKQAQ